MVFLIRANVTNLCMYKLFSSCHQKLIIIIATYLNEIHNKRSNHNNDIHFSLMDKVRQIKLAKYVNKGMK